ncbi:Uncharacterized protein PECH_004469 [Penicillium ucsense]|uniref:Major facilitator superfamily (MFS) profile domain-containing protein n=1 Tax=Penicillium ucsense TaxID=2839758 RepID=A0A8J8W563_9EURO|nr:Uncharacterized protein PECM_004825 [Penicillium ucsense]KAF7736981.1 Uncharacterized protein PECH_004469 [Penicillium ucsense]
MGQHEIDSGDAFGRERKTTIGILSTISPDVHEKAQESQLQLFEGPRSDEQQQWHPDLRDWLVFVNILVSAMMDTFDATVMIPIVPQLANALNEPIVTTLWVSTSYLIASTASQLFFTMACDVFTHGPLWIVAGVLSTVGSGICGGSTSLTELIIGRSIQGIGGGGATALCFVIMQDTTPKSIHSRYSCYIHLTRFIGMVLGPAVGGIFTDKGNWTWACYFNFVFCGLGLLLIPVSVDLRISRNIPLRTLRILDWSGATMAILGPTSLLIGLAWGGVLYKWTEWQTIMPIAVGLSTMIALVLYESTWALRPYFGSKVFRSTTTTMTYIGGFCHGFVLFAQMQHYAFFLMLTKDFSATHVGLSLLALTGFALTPAAVVGVAFADKPQYTRYITSGGWTLNLLASGCSILLGSKTPIIGFLFLLLTAGLGHGLLLASYSTKAHSMAGSGSKSFARRPVAVSNFMRAWGMAMAIPIGGVIFLNMHERQLEQLGLRKDLVNTAQGYMVLMNQVKMSHGERTAMHDASSKSLQVVWMVMTAVSALGGFSTVFAWGERL